MANLLDQASIVLTPTAYDNGKVLCAKPSEAPYGDFDFSRNSAATRVNAQGLVENVQILSSNLVQNGDFSEEGVEEVSNGSFSQIGPEEVTNGDFSQIGPEEVSNGSFSQEGVELVTNGDFYVSGTPNTTSWTLGWYSNTNNVEIANGKLTLSNSAIESASRAYATNGVNSNNILTTNKFYKLQYDIVENNGATDLKYYSANGSFISVPSVDVGSYTLYIQNTSNSLFLFQLVTSNASISIDNCSIREVGQDWSLIGTATITENQANIVTASAVTGISQSNILTVGKSYKLSYNIVSNNNGGLKISGNEIPSVVGNNTYYFEASTASLEILRNSGITDISITNISVKEVGQDWNIGSDWSIAENKAVSSGSGNNLQQTINISSNKTYKLTFDVISTSGTLAFDLGGATAKTLTDSGSKEYYFKRVNNNNLRFYGGNYYGSVTNISVKEIPDWTLGTGWSIGEDKAVANTIGNANLLQASAITSGKIYKATFEVSDYQSGSVRINLGGAGLTGVGNLYSANGVYTQYITSDAVDVYIQGRSSFIGSVTNISVKEVGMDWDFTSTTTVGDGFANILSDGSYQYIRQQNVLQIGKLYKITYEITRNNGGSIKSTSFNISGLVSDVGIHTLYRTASQTRLFIERNQACDIDITNILVIEITNDTNLPRINYEGFSYQDALGSELITNGNFATDSDWVKGTGWTISGGTANTDGTPSSEIRQNNVTTVGKEYKYSFTISNSGGGVIDARFRNKSTGSPILNFSNEGTYSGTFTSNGTFIDFVTLSNNTASFSIDNVSVKEYLGQEVVPNSGCGSWLWEPQSTNLITYSEDFSQWADVNSTILSNNAISPSGIQDAYKITSTSTGDSAFVRNSSVTQAISTTYSFSCFVKKGTTNFVRLANRAIGGATNSSAWFDIENGVVGVLGALLSSSNIEDYGNGWYRCTAISNTGGTIANQLLDITACTSDGVAGAVTGDFMYIYGAQMEALPYSTSYIPTSGSTVTRNQDVCTNGGSLATINSTEGVLYAEIAALANDGTIREISINNGSIFNRVSIYYTASVIYAKWQGANGGIDLFHIIPEVTDFHKVAIKYKSGDTALWVDGLEVDTSSSVNSTSGLNVLDFDRADGANNFYGKTKALAVWKEALSDQELADLTYPTPTDPTFTLDFDTIAEQFTFARGSEATYVDAQGLIQSTNELGEELVVNGDFATDSDWVKQSSWSIANGSANCDGSGGYRSISQSALINQVGKTYKISYEVSNYVSGEVRFILGGLNLGQIVSANGVYTETIQAVNPSTNSYIYIETRGSGFVGSIDNISVKEHITATNTPRLDYSTGAEAFLLEPQSTNLVVNSSLGSPKTPYDGATNYLAPDGASSAFTPLVSTSSNRFESVINGGNYVSGTELTYSWYRKRISTPLDPSFLGDLDVKSFVNATFSSTTQIASDISGYDRFSVKVTITDGSLESKIRAYYGSLIGVGNSSVAYWGHQLELGSYATSYIPTSGTTVTRNQELCYDATPEINSEEGVLYAEISALADDLTNRYITISDGSNTNYIRLTYTTTSNQIAARYYVNGAFQCALSHILTDETEFIKVSFKWRENDFALWVNGVEVATDTSGNVNPANTFNRLDFSRYDGIFPFFGNTKDLQVYPKALSDAELIKLTT